MKRIASANWRRAGMSLVEVLISVSITGALLTSVAASYHSASSIARETEEFNRAVSGGRIALNRMLTELRTAQSGVVDDSSLEIITAAGEKRLYEYDADNDRLTITFPDAITPSVYTVARNVGAVLFTTDETTITVQLTTRVGSNAIVLSGSATPRRNVEYH